MKIRLNDHLNGFFFKSKMHIKSRHTAISAINTFLLIINHYFYRERALFLLNL